MSNPPSTSLAGKSGFIVTLGMLTAIAALTIDISLPAIPAMVEALQTNLPRGQLIVGIFMGGMALGQIPFGLISDRAGRQPVLFAGMCLFTVAAIAAASTNDIGLMLAARFVQGFGAASAIVLSRAIVRDIASGTDAARLMSLMTMVFTAAPVIAPSVGAPLTTIWGWRAPFIAIAAGALVMLLAIRRYLPETHTPAPDGKPLQQLRRSVSTFFSHRQSIFALLLIVIPPAGFMSVIAVSAALVVEIYGYSVRQYGVIFALAGISILLGATVNRWLVLRYRPVTLMAVGAALMCIAGLQLLCIAWLNSAPFWWLWSCVCLFMFTVAILVANATVVALDPLPSIAGVASSILGTSQNIFGASGAMLSAWLYDGSIRNTIIIMGLFGTAAGVVFALRPLLAPGDFAESAGEMPKR